VKLQNNFHVEWSKLNALDFVKAKDYAKKTCIIPCGCYEKHGNHLPLGTDMIIAHTLAVLAAKEEYAVVYPNHYYTQVSEVGHYPGTIAFPAKHQIEILQEICDEVYRNGFEKIILLNSHGGNGHLLNYFCQTQLDKPRDYIVYAYHVWPLSKEQLDHLDKKYDLILDLGHAGVKETSVIMAIDSSLVKMEYVVPDEGEALRRNLETTKSGLFTAINWYANFPNHIAGDPNLAFKEYGQDIIDMQTIRIAKAIKIAKENKVMPDLQKEFYARTKRS